MYFADIANPSVKAGNTNDLKSALPPETVTQWSITPKILKNINPNQKLGIESPVKLIALTK